ncbi:hypothetical protein ACI7RC_27410 [Brevibacillus sp. B_LB10_24]|uniref:hypothetical protein n=1 Tax=Brevibacillus sp. B_LB10_24 TaxID=3380645 RepID=UPI0038BCF53B
MDYKVCFEQLDWNEAAPGCRDKIAVFGESRLRLVEFTDQFVEDGWCVRGHLGGVLAGRATLHFPDSSLSCQQGDGLFLPEGKPHKVTVAAGERVLFLFVEKA